MHEIEYKAEKMENGSEEREEGASDEMGGADE